MGDTRYPYPLTLQWRDGPERLRKLKNKLLLYFQKRSESNGGECEIRDTDCSRGHILIHFKDEAAQKGVLQKGHHVLKLPNGEELHLELALPEARGPDTARTTPTPTTSSRSGRTQNTGAADDDVTQVSSLVLIENVQDSCPPEILNPLVEKISEKTQDMNFHVERIPEIQSAVVTFTCDIDIPSFMDAFSSSLQVHHKKLRARPLEEPRSIRVENLPENTPEMHLQVFFENPKQGGGKVEEMVMLPEEGAALMKFRDTADVKRVLMKEHLFSKKKISVYPYYPLLNVALYGKEGPAIEIPKPVEFNISPYILQHICNNDGLKNNIEVKMKDKHGDIKWPNQDCPNPVLQLHFPPSLSNHPRSAAKIIPKWNEDVYNEFSLFISKFRVTEYKMDQLVWEAIEGQVNSSTYNDVLIKPGFGSEKVFLAGLSKDVTKIDSTFRQLIEETTKRVERKKLNQTETLSMSPALYQILCNSGLQKKILDQVPELKIDYDVPTKEAHLSGLRDEVLVAKCEILNIKQQLKSKLLQLNPHLVQFLMSTDNEDLSCQLFVHQNVNALLEMDDGAVKLMACSKEDLTAAEKQIKEKLLYVQLLVEDNSLLKSPEWQSLHLCLLQSFNKEKSTVLIQETSTGPEDHVVIAGLSSDVHRCQQQVSDFLKENTPIETDVKVQASSMIKFIWEERKEILDKIRKNVNVTKYKNNISLSGPRMKVQEAEDVIKNIVSSLHCDSLRIDKPGAKTFCKVNERVHSTTARVNFQCVITVEEVGIEDSLCGKPKFQVTLPNGMTLSVYKDNLCHHNVDVIVNAANEDLQHIGGLAKAILDAAGSKIQDDSNQIIRKGGKLLTGDSVITDAGKLPCKQIIHTVGPRWDPNSASRCERLLRRAITTSLQLAIEKNHSSIAIPAVSSGVFGFPLKFCVETIVEAIRDFVEEPRQKGTLQRIHLVDLQDETINLFSEVLKAKFSNQKGTVPSTSKVTQPEKRVMESTPPVPASRGGDNAVMTKEGLTIKMLQKNIEDCSTDVIVNSIGDDLNLSKGAISKALLSRAGPAMQLLLCNESGFFGPKPGSLYSTDGCNLNCQEVLHVVTPQWDNGQGTSETILRGIITKCLTQAEQNQRTSISFPAFGTGNLGFPKVLVASAMFDEIFQFSCKNKVRNLQEVHLVLHPKDRETIKTFTSQLASCTDAPRGVTNRQSTGTASTFFGTVTNPSLGVHEMNLGSITYQVMTGDITKEQADVIVNSSNQDFSLYTGVSKAILDAAGSTVRESAVALGCQPHNGYATTGPGNLTQCKWIVHVNGPKQPGTIKKNILDVLQECEKLQASSVTFPALGTGAGGIAASVVADSIINGVVDFINAKSVNSLQMVKVVLFQQNMLNDFYMSMKKKEGTALPQPKSLFSRFTYFIMPNKAPKPVQKLTAFQLVSGIEPVVFSLCAENKKNVERTKAWLQQQIEYEQAKKVIREDCISQLKEADVQKISDLQKKFQVSVIYKPPDPCIWILGLTRDVLSVSGEIELIINQLRDRKNKERIAELTAERVEWKYDNGGSMVPFDKMTNLELEEAETDNKVQVTVQIGGHKYTVDLQNKKATDRHGRQVEIQRIVKHEGNSLSLPSHWNSKGNALVMEVDLAAGSPEYSVVEAKFQKSCRNQIIKILRVQNRDLWLNYQIKKQSIDTKNGSTNNERELFHGTDYNSILHVNKNGFNRSYAGRNAAAYGNGTYFAVNAAYSAHAQFAKPDANRQQHMYLARVLTGLFCTGKQGMIAPPPKNAGNATDLYDSVTDNPGAPTMFVIFNDIQAYPEYHIIFQ